MKDYELIVESIKEKYSEHLEMAGERAPQFISEILATKLVAAYDEIEYLKKRLEARDVKTRING